MTYTAYLQGTRVRYFLFTQHIIYVSNNSTVLLYIHTYIYTWYVRTTVGKTDAKIVTLFCEIKSLC